MQPSVRDRWLHGFAVAVLITASLAILQFQQSLLRTRTFDADEFQHAHSAYLIAQGQLPYRDYFEHHPPLLHVLMAPVIAALEPGRDGASAFETLFTLRVLLWTFGFVGLLAHHLVARRLLGALGGAVASLLLVSTVIVFEKSMEIRPDTPAMALLACALFLLRPESSPGRVFGAFSLLGVGLLFTQKLAFPALGILAALFLAARSEMRMRRLVAIIGGLLWPTVVCALWFVAKGAGMAFIEDVFLINLRWKARLAPGPFFVTRFLEPNPLFALAGTVGLVDGLIRVARARPAVDDGSRIVLFSALTGVMGLAFLPVAWEQYYLLFLPQTAIVAGGVLLRIAGQILRRPQTTIPVTALVVTVTLLGLLPRREALLNQRFRTSEAKERAIALVLDNSSTSDTVLDGYSGIGVFRPHAFRYFFLHAEMRMMLDSAAVRELEEGLTGGAIAPRFASADSHLRSVSPRVRDFLDRNFAPIGDGPVEVRLFPGAPEAWNDRTPRFIGQVPPATGAFVLALDGWSPRQSAGGRTFRRSRGKTSALVFSVRDPDALNTMRLEARAGADVAGLSALMRLNGRDIGEIALGPAFSTFDVPLEAGLVVRGLNRLEFLYPRRPAQVNAMFTGEDNATLALESLALSSAHDR